MANKQAKPNKGKNANKKPQETAPGSLVYLVRNQFGNIMLAVRPEFYTGPVTVVALRRRTKDMSKVSPETILGWGGIRKQAVRVDREDSAWVYYEIAVPAGTNPNDHAKQIAKAFQGTVDRLGVSRKGGLMRVCPFGMKTHLKIGDKKSLAASLMYQVTEDNLIIEMYLRRAVMGEKMGQALEILDANQFKIGHSQNGWQVATLTITRPQVADLRDYVYVNFAVPMTNIIQEL